MVSNLEAVTSNNVRKRILRSVHHAGAGAGASIAASPRDYEGLRIGPYKYIRYQSGAKELYDLRDDPYELRSRHNDPRYLLVKRWLSALLTRLQLCAARSEHPRNDHWFAE